MLCDSDTLYSMGYYGLRKYLTADKKNLILLSENTVFAKNRMIYRGGCVYNDYLFVTTRNWLPGSKGEKDMGALLVMSKRDLKIIRAIVSDIKLIEAHTEGNSLVVSGIGGFNIFDISEPNRPKLVFKYRRKDYREYQGFDVMQHEGKLYAAFALFSQGMELWDITNRRNPRRLADERLPMKGQSMDLVCDYPKIYATIGPEQYGIKGENDIRGLIVYDISEIPVVKKDVVTIPSSEYYSRTTGDCQPIYLCRYHDKLYLNFSEKGLAVFNIQDKEKPRYSELIDVGRRALIQPITVSSKGDVYAGSYYWPDIYTR